MSNRQQVLHVMAHRYIKNRLGRDGQKAIPVDECEMWNRIFDEQRQDDPWVVDLELVEAMATICAHYDNSFDDRVFGTRTIQQRDFLAFFLPAFIKEFQKRSTAVAMKDATYWNLNHWVKNTFGRIAKHLPVEHLRRTVGDVSDAQKRLFGEMCVQKQCIGLAVVAYLLCLEWDLIPPLLQKKTRMSSEYFWSGVFWFSYTHGAPQLVTLEILHVLYRNTCYFLNTDLFEREQLKALVGLCSMIPYLHNWLVYFGIHAADQEEANGLLKRNRLMKLASPDQSTRGMILVAAAQIKHIAFVKEFFAFCTDEAVINQLIQMYMHDQTQADLLNDLCLYEIYLACPEVIGKKMVECFEFYEEDRISYTLICIRKGLSTHYPDGSELCVECLEEQSPSHLCLLLESGAVSYQQYYHSIRTVTLLDQDLVNTVERNIPRLLQKSVRSLEGMCLLLVSHFLGCSHDRLHRIDELELPEVFNEMLEFKHLYSHA